MTVTGGTALTTIALSGKITAFQNPWIVGAVSLTTAAIVEGIFYYFGNDYQEADIENLVSAMSPEELKALLVKMGMDESAAANAAAAFNTANKKTRKSA